MLEWWRSCLGPPKSNLEQSFSVGRFDLSNCARFKLTQLAAKMKDNAARQLWQPVRRIPEEGKCS